MEWHSYMNIGTSSINGINAIQRRRVIEIWSLSKVLMHRSLKLSTCVDLHRFFTCLSVLYCFCRERLNYSNMRSKDDVRPADPQDSPVHITHNTLLGCSVFAIRRYAVTSVFLLPLPCMALNLGETLGVTHDDQTHYFCHVTRLWQTYWLQTILWRPMLFLIITPVILFPCDWYQKNNQWFN